MLGSRRDAVSNGANVDRIDARLVATDEEATIARHAQVPENVARA
jgi:hypothetical protein